MSFSDNLILHFDPSEVRDNYVYMFLHNNVPFYVGVGKGRRWRRHFYQTERIEKDNPHKYRKIQKIFRDNEKVEVRIIAHGLSKQETLNLEIKLIKDIGRKCDGGTLTNMSTGGESGATGRNHSEEHKEYMSNRMRGVLGGVTDELVYKAKLLYHYRGMKPKDIVKLPEYSHLTKSCISAWISKSNSNYSYIAPHLKCEKEIYDEMAEESRKLYETGRWNYTEVANILGISRTFVSSACRGMR